MSVDDIDPNRFQSETHRRARKPHQCCACHETIRRGDVYMLTTICDYDGGMSAYKWCLRCNAIGAALWAYGAGTIDMTLDCGHTWEENEDLHHPIHERVPAALRHSWAERAKWREPYRNPPDDVARLAFLTPDEAQKELKP